MAVPNLTETITATLAAQSEEVADNVTNNIAALLWIKKAGGVRPVDGGYEIREPLLYAGSTNGGWFSGAEVLPIASEQVLSAASFDIKEYAVAITVTNREELTNSGRAARIDLVAQKLKGAKSQMQNDMETGVYSNGTGSGGKQLTGLLAAVPVDPTTGTYGGIDRAVNTFWQSQMVDTNAAPASGTIQGFMNQLWVKCTRGADRPKLILADNLSYAAYMASLQNLQRVTDPAKAKLGFSAIQYIDADVVLSGGIGGAIDTATMLFLNTDYLFMRPMKGMNMVPIGDKRTSINQMVTTQFLGFMGNMTTSAARQQGRLILS